MAAPYRGSYQDPNEEPGKIRLRDDPGFAATKMTAFQYVAVGVFLFLVTGFWDLQIRHPDIYKGLAERNRIKELPVVAPRGKILDRDGRVIVDNHSSWSLILSRENLREEHLHEIAEGLHLDYDDLVRRSTATSATEVRADHHQGRTDAGRTGVRGVAPRSGDVSGDGD